MESKSSTRCSGRSKGKWCIIPKIIKKYNIPRSSLERHVCAAEKGVSLTGQGRRKSVFSTDKTQDLKQCIVALAVLRFGMQIKDVTQLVESYVQHNNYEKGEKVLKFKGRPGYPGPDW